MRDMMERNRRLFVANRREFQGHFGLSLKCFWDHLYGFDMTKFDAFIDPGENESIRDKVASKYGEAAVAVIERLCGDPPTTETRSMIAS